MRDHVTALTIPGFAVGWGTRGDCTLPGTLG
jgi:hypothetical protein